MKSAYELAMERLDRASPQSKSPPLTDAQKAKLANVDSLYRSKIAEKELFLKPQIDKARMEGDALVIDSLEKQLRTETASLREEMEGEKDKIRNAR